MILNMTGGQNDVQIVDFTLTEDVNVESSGAEGIGAHFLEISNVIVHGGVHGFFIIKNDSTSPNYSFSVSHFYTDYLGDTGVIRGNLWYVYFGYDSGQITKFLANKNTNGNAFFYNAESKTLCVATALADTFVKAGKYRLVIW